MQNQQALESSSVLHKQCIFLEGRREFQAQLSQGFVVVAVCVLPAFRRFQGQARLLSGRLSQTCLLKLAACLSALLLFRAGQTSRTSGWLLQAQLFLTIMLLGCWPLPRLCFAVPALRALRSCLHRSSCPFRLWQQVRCCSGQAPQPQGSIPRETRLLQLLRSALPLKSPSLPHISPWGLSVLSFSGLRFFQHLDRQPAAHGSPLLKQPRLSFFYALLQVVAAAGLPLFFCSRGLTGLWSRQACRKFFGLVKVQVLPFPLPLRFLFGRSLPLRPLCNLLQAAGQILSILSP